MSNFTVESNLKLSILNVLKEHNIYGCLLLRRVGSYVNVQSQVQIPSSALDIMQLWGKESLKEAKCIGPALAMQKVY